ncbi:hypothetical protein B0T10DRAFT_197433 [Thelonectria olida]|uniref:Uncharacterized protein n=1 Tax=Thelonectria olida TaxID=1576542 RepID=A0A9P9AK63_9HYPO|nr:hypothetical protein B0T10DRAFT_197433 [Thelonectria olida]
MKFSVLIAALFSTATVSALTQAQAQSRLEAAGIYATSSGGCTTKSNPKCTSYDGIRENTVQGAITLKKACGCSVTITGGTETGHASGTYSHGTGYKLDFAKASGLNSYITNTFTKIANRGDGYPQWKAASGNIYCDEGNHWDVVFYSNGG